MALASPYSLISLGLVMGLAGVGASFAGQIFCIIRFENSVGVISSISRPGLSRFHSRMISSTVLSLILISSVIGSHHSPRRAASPLARETIHTCILRGIIGT